MKITNARFLLLLGIVSSQALFAQNILYVNNTDSRAPEHFSSLQVAIDSAQNNDTIYIAPSPTSYGNATLTKKLTIYGAGYYIPQNPGLNISTLAHNCSVGVISMNAGSNGSRMEGCVATRINLTNTNSIKIKRCFVSSKIIVQNSDSCQVLSCYFNGFAIGEVGTDYDYIVSYFSDSDYGIVANNIFDSGTSSTASTLTPHQNYYDNLQVSSNSSALVLNNIFRDRCEIGDNTIFSNNISLCTWDAITASGTAVVQNNVFAFNESAYAANNIVNYGESGICVGYPAIGAYSFDSRWQLASGSPAIGYASNGGDCGVFDGDFPYKLSGIPGIPVITNINLTDVIPNNGMLQITIKTRKEN